MTVWGECICISTFFCFRSMSLVRLASQTAYCFACLTPTFRCLQTPLRRTKRHFFRDHISSSATSTMNVFVVTATLYNNERTDTPDAGSSTAEKARTVDDNSPADSLARQDVLRNTLIGVLGLLFSAGSLIVAVQHNRRNECRQRDLEASPDSNGHTELAGLRPLDGEGGTQRRGQLPPLERNSRLPARHTNRTLSGLKVRLRFFRRSVGSQRLSKIDRLPPYAGTHHWMTKQLCSRRRSTVTPDFELGAATDLLPRGGRYIPTTSVPFPWRYKQDLE
jgi:hypothetical protein